MGRPSWVLIALAMSALELPGGFGYVAEPLPTYRPKKYFPVEREELPGGSSYVAEPLPTYRPKKSFPIERDDSAIYFPEQETVEDRRPHTGSKRSLSDSDVAPARFSDLYPQTSFFNAERPARQEPAGHGPQNGWGNPPPPWGNPGFNNPHRQHNHNRPNSGGGGGGGGGNQPWGNGGGNFNRPANNDYDESPFVFDRPPSNGGGRPGRPQPGNGGVARPQPGNGGAARPQPGNGGAARPQPGQQRPGNNGGAGGRPRPTVTSATTTPRPTAAPTTRPAPGAPVTAPTPAPTRAGCNCPSTAEFNPVCGQDRVTYTNPGKLRCANACGNNVMMLHFGACITTTTPPPSG